VNGIGTDSGLPAEFENFNYLLVFVGILLAQVAEEAAASPNELEQAATGVVVVLVNFEVLDEMLDARGEQTDLDAGGAGVLIVSAEFLHYFRIGGSGHVLFPND
jgi:hypothetical protein